jgi:hypothetical protein
MRSHLVFGVTLLAALAALSCSDGGTKATTPSDGGSPSPSMGASAALVSQCESLASTISAGCTTTSDASRACYFTAYGKLCKTGNTQLLVDSMNCVKGASCRSFSDANDSASCLAQVHATGESAKAKATLTQLCTACGGTDCSTITGTAEVIPYLSDADLAAVPACTGSDCSAAGIGASCSAIADIAMFAACPQ